jgi:Molybdopterin-binding domain of aldehyde dehydrogenase
LDAWLEIARDGSVTAYCGHIDMGTGIQTAVAQIVADELEVPLDAVRVVMGDTDLTPDQGKSTSSRGVTLGAQPLRIAACEARRALIERGSKALNVPKAELEARVGPVRMKASPHNGVAYGDLIGGRAFSINLEVAETTLFGPKIKTKTLLKSPADYRVVGKSIPLMCRRRSQVSSNSCPMFECPACCMAESCASHRLGQSRWPSTKARSLAFPTSGSLGVLIFSAWSQRGRSTPSKQRRCCAPLGPSTTHCHRKASYSTRCG